MQFTRFYIFYFIQSLTRSSRKSTKMHPISSPTPSDCKKGHLQKTINNAKPNRKIVPTMSSLPFKAVKSPRISFKNFLTLLLFHATFSLVIRGNEYQS